MARITAHAFRKLQAEFPAYVTDDDADLSEFELLYAICTRQRDDLVDASANAERSRCNLARADRMIQTLNELLDAPRGRA